MDHPYYTATVTSLTRGWSYSATEGDDWNPADDVVLISPLSYAWSFKGDQIPGQLEACTAAVNIAARTASDIPNVEIGDLLTLDVRVGTAGSRIIAPPPMRVATANTTLSTKGVYAATLAITLVDLSADWRSRALDQPLGQPTTNPGGDRKVPRPYWRERGAEIATVVKGGGVSIGCPTWWVNNEDTESTSTDGAGRDVFGLNNYSNGREFEGALADVLESFANSHFPAGHPHTWTTVYNSHPSGYQWIGPSTWVDGTTSAIPAGGALSDPGGVIRIEATPATRKTPTASGLPLILAVSGGLLRVVSRQPAAPGVIGSGSADSFLTQLGIDSDWCVIPATARRARESVINTLNIEGPGHEPTGSVGGGGVSTYNSGRITRTAVDAVSVAARGTLARNVSTMLALGSLDGALPYYAGPEVAILSPLFLSDATALSGSWTYDGFTLFSKLIPQALAAWLLPRVAPRLPGETDGDGRLVRQVTIYDLDGSLRFGGEPVSGFVTAGRMDIVGGDIVWSLNTAPGRAIYVTGGINVEPTPVTFGEMETIATANGLHADDIDPLITFADLAYVDS